MSQLPLVTTSGALLSASPVLVATPAYTGRVANTAMSSCMRVACHKGFITSLTWPGGATDAFVGIMAWRCVPVASARHVT